MYTYIYTKYKMYRRDDRLRREGTSSRVPSWGRDGLGVSSPSRWCAQH